MEHFTDTLGVEMESVTEDERRVRVRTFAALYILIGLLFFAIGPGVFSSTWVSSADFHSCIEMVGSLFALSAGVAALLYFLALKNRYFLVIGLGFLIAGSEDLIHGILSWDRLFEGTDVDFSRFIPGTYVAGRTVLAVMTMLAPVLENSLKKVKNEIREACVFSSVAALFGGGATALAFLLPLPQFIYPERVISRPVDFISALLFLAAFVLILRRYLRRRDVFSGVIAASLLFNLGGQIYMSFSKQLYDVFFDVAHWAKVFGYVMPVLGISLQTLEEMRRSSREIGKRRRLEGKLRGAYDEMEMRVKDRTADLVRSNSKLEREITEHKQAKEALAERSRALERSNAELQQFAYVASHDLQEPLRMVASYVQLLARRYEGKLDADADDFIRYAADGAKRMQALIDALLTYSRVETHAKPFHRTDCNEVLRVTLENLQVAIEEKHAEVTSDVLPTVTADRVQLEQLFQNLIDNGIKFQGRETPRVHLSAEQQDGQWVFSFRDNGIGIEPQYSERVFVIFQRLHGTGEYPGTGIGLSICKRIVERHGGHIWVESEPGRGSKFLFTIPVMGKEQS